MSVCKVSGCEVQVNMRQARRCGRAAVGQRLFSAFRLGIERSLVMIIRLATCIRAACAVYKPGAFPTRVCSR